MGSAVTNLNFNIGENSVAVAHYLDKSLDSDGDAIPDWYELRYLGNLDANQSHDNDGDGISLLQEYRFDLSPSISDQSKPGGISRRRSQTTFVNLGGARKLSISSDPRGLLASEITYPEVNSTFVSTNLSGANGSYYFSHWEVNGVRVADEVGIGLSKVVEVMDTDKQVVAKYFDQDQDDDSDGIPDWYEWHTFGTLSNDKSSDSDNDSILLSEERKFGLNAAISDSLKPGGISRRRSATVAVNLGGATRVRLYSQPTGLIPSQTLFLENNSTFSTDTLSGLSHGYYFSHWEVNGQRMADSTGIGLGAAQTVLDASKEIVAKFYDQDEDLDADDIPDWFEWQQFGTLSFGETSDPDGDGIPIQVERVFGMSSVIADQLSPGGLSRRRSTSTSFVFDPAGVVDSDGDGLSDDLENSLGTNPELADTDGDGYDDAEEYALGTDPTSATSLPNQPPSNLLPMDQDLTILENRPVGTVVTQFQASDADGDLITFSLSAGNGDGDNALFSIDNNGTLQSLAVFDYELNASTFSIRVSASDGNQGVVEGNFTIYLLDVDDTPPVLLLNGDANITHLAGYPYFDANATWMDEVDGNGTISGSGEVNATVPGKYLLSYTYTDEAGNAAQTAIREIEVINLPPEDLYVLNDAPLSILENEPNGTKVAVFYGSDQNPDSILSYRLMDFSDLNHSFDPNMTENNISELQALNIFRLDENGALFTLRPLDYEIDPTEIPILVRVTDQHGAHFEKLFIVSVANVVEDFDGDGVEDYYDPDDDGDGYEDNLEDEYGFNSLDRWHYPEAPIIRTLKVEEHNQTLVFRAHILSSGGVGNMEAGISVFDESGAFIHESSTSWKETDGEILSFSLAGFVGGQKIRYQAFAHNLAGGTTGQFLEYRVGGNADFGKWWSADKELEGGWRESTWLGTYLPNQENEWVYHLQLGWLFVQLDGQGGFWMWMPEEKWLWTKQGVWPFLWSDATAGWLYPIYVSGNRYFYDYSNEGIR